MKKTRRAALHTSAPPPLPQRTPASSHKQFWGNPPSQVPASLPPLILCALVSFVRLFVRNLLLAFECTQSHL
jgi:hypothetical protein